MKGSKLYNGVNTKKDKKELMFGYNLAKDRIKNSGINKAYKKALNLSKRDIDKLSIGERGYIINVTNNLFSKKGRSLDAAEIYSNIDVLDGEIKRELKKRLIKDISKTNKMEYFSRVEEFMKKNKMNRFGKFNSLEQAVQKAGKISRFSIALILTGFIFSSYNITGNVIGASIESGKTIGTLLFSAGIIWMAISVKKINSKN